MYAKLFSRIAQSSLMEEDVRTRYVFMMLLAIADKSGNVIGTDVAIARMLNISKDDFCSSVDNLMMPDPDSNSPDHDGKRIIASDEGRGYRVVNYEAYRSIKSDDEKRAYMREYMRQRREKERKEREDKSGKKGSVNSVNSRKTPLTDVTQAEAEAEAEPKKTPPTPQRGASAPTQAVAWSEAGGWSGITEDDLRSWREAYPACDIKRQLAVMTEWLKSNPAKARKKQWRRFVTNWLSRTQDRGGDAQSNRPNAPKPPAKATEGPEGPEGWQDAYRELFPHAPAAVIWSLVDRQTQNQIQESLTASKS